MIPMVFTARSTGIGIANRQARRALRARGCVPVHSPLRAGGEGGGVRHDTLDPGSHGPATGPLASATPTTRRRAAHSLSANARAADLGWRPGVAESGP